MLLKSYFISICIAFKLCYCQRSTAHSVDSFMEKKYMVYFVQSSKKYDHSYLCGGALVSPKQILTAAACLVEVENIYAIAGYRKYVNTNDIELDECTKSKKQKVIKILVPTEYKLAYENPAQWINVDIGVAIVEKSFNFDDLTYRTICSYEPQSISVNFEGKYESESVRAIAFGWASTKAGNQEEVNSKHFQEATTVVVNKKYCANTINEQEVIYIINKYLLCVNSTDEETTKYSSRLDSCKDGKNGCDGDFQFRRTINGKNINDTEEEKKLSYELKRNEANARRFSYMRKSLVPEMCQNSHGSPLIRQIGDKEVIMGIASNANKNNECVGPFLYVSTAATAIIIKCLLEIDAIKRKICNQQISDKRYEIQEIDINWSNDTQRSLTAEVVPMIIKRSLPDKPGPLMARPTKDIVKNEANGAYSKMQNQKGEPVPGRNNDPSFRQRGQSFEDVPDNDRDQYRPQVEIQEEPSVQYDRQPGQQYEQLPQGPGYEQQFDQGGGEPPQDTQYQHSGRYRPPPGQQNEPPPQQEFDQGPGQQYAPPPGQQYESQQGQEYRAPPAQQYEPQQGEQYDQQMGQQSQPRPSENYEPQPGETYELSPREQYGQQTGQQFEPQHGERSQQQPSERYEPQPGEQYEPQTGQQYEPQAGEKYGQQPAEKYEQRPSENYEPRPGEKFEPQPRDQQNIQQREQFEPHPLKKQIQPSGQQFEQQPGIQQYDQLQGQQYETPQYEPPPDQQHLLTGQQNEPAKQQYESPVGDGQQFAPSPDHQYEPPPGQQYEPAAVQQYEMQSNQDQPHDPPPEQQGKPAQGQQFEQPSGKFEPPPRPQIELSQSKQFRSPAKLSSDPPPIKEYDPLAGQYAQVIGEHTYQSQPSQQFEQQAGQYERARGQQYESHQSQHPSKQDSPPQNRQRGQPQEGTIAEEYQRIRNIRPEDNIKALGPRAVLDYMARQPNLDVYQQRTPKPHEAFRSQNQQFGRPLGKGRQREKPRNFDNLFTDLHVMSEDTAGVHDFSDESPGRFVVPKREETFESVFEQLHEASGDIPHEINVPQYNGPPDEQYEDLEEQEPTRDEEPKAPQPAARQESPSSLRNDGIRVRPQMPLDYQNDYFYYSRRKYDKSPT